MDVRSLELPLRAFGVEPGHARVELGALSQADRLRRAGAMLGIGLAISIIAIPIPLVHLVLVPGGVVLGLLFGLMRLNQREVFRRVEGSCPVCDTRQTFTVMGTFRLPKKLFCASCHRELSLESTS